VREREGWRQKQRMDMSIARWALNTFRKRVINLLHELQGIKFGQAFVSFAPPFVAVFVAALAYFLPVGKTFHHLLVVMLPAALQRWLLDRKTLIMLGCNVRRIIMYVLLC